MNDVKRESEIYDTPDTSARLDSLLHKIQKERRTAVFCGHFSAGKSTILNQIIGRDLLPSHPIPTSANVVHISKGDVFSATYKASNSERYQTLSLHDLSDEWFTNSENIEEIFMELPVEHFPANLEVIDTPGIDSTDHAHYLAAQSRLTEADSIYYIVDYQQVESSENFSFLQQLNDKYIYPTLIINQIDKHNNSELSFSEYKQKILDSIAKHNISLRNILYLSATNPAISKDDWNQLMHELFSQDQPSEQVRQTTALGIYREIETLALHIDHSIRPAKEEQNQILAYSNFTTLIEEIYHIQRTLEEVPHWSNFIEKDLIEAFNLIFANAKLTPYHTRNFIRDYLESRQATFRIKGLFKNKKTTKEKHRRQSVLLHSLNENIRNYIDIHLRQSIEDILRKYGINAHVFQEEIMSLQHKADTTLLQQAERRGALFSQEYVLTYSKTVVDEIRQKYKASLIQLFPLLKKHLHQVIETENSTLRTKLGRLQQLRTTWEEWNQNYKQLTSFVKEFIQRLEACKKILPSSTFSQSPASLPMPEPLYHQSEIDIRSYYTDSDSRENTNEFNSNSFSQAIEDHSNRIEHALYLLNEAPGLTNIKHSLNRRLERLQRKQYKIALFGAFSAGKSSIANALLGEKILPVAANPTTASIQYIKAPDVCYEHKTVKIIYKTSQDILQDMNDIIRPASVTLSSIEDWNALLEEKMEQDENNEQKDERNEEKESTGEKEEQQPDPFRILTEEEIHLLNQYYDNYHYSYSRLGNETITDIHHYATLASTEEEAMLMKEVTIYFDSPFTREGYLLTDTPGAGSIYRRHSEVAFKEMKEADSILFVSYYNHSFSKADREFLLQLGRTKEYFSYDKMLFLVNASDLAKSHTELNEVLDYVKTELIQFGIRNPQVYPVSGKMAINSDTNFATKDSLETSGMNGFLRNFRYFIIKTLDELIIREADQEIRQAVHLLEDKIHTAHLDRKERHHLQQQRKEELIQFHDYLETYPFELDMERIMQELEELLFYVKQRVFYRYYDEYKEIFNIARIEEADFQHQIYRYTNELINFIFHELTQEIRATIIRMEYFIQKHWSHIQSTMTSHLPHPLKEEFVTLKVEEFPEFDIHSEAPINSGDLPFLNQFKSYKEFFAGEQTKLFKEQLEEALRPYGSEFVEGYHKIMAEHYKLFLLREWEHLRSEYLNTAQYVMTANEQDLPPQQEEQMKHVLKRLKMEI
ncbi:dynamin family protein [Alteribacillus iranensis]|uniref:Dynamin family protein n=1 Tax=Alteribacillus iranensis TaxID=930128 RepID=A0A1I1ZYX0_9BACI|nr:dynamin family protein [Alteribacillus iranensis]SFE36902.1 Dynamin family protein [Alteribacillus iranensis]